jgi:hypothetical protein
MKKIRYTCLLLIALFTVPSCRKGNDLYVNPNSPTAANPSTMLVAVEANTFMNYEGGMTRIASIWMQHNSGVSAQFTATDTYDVIASDMDNYWQGLYVGAMKNAQLLYKQYETANPWYGGISKILLAFNLGIATDLWGDVPYAEAFQLENNVSMPHYDPQATILNDIQSLLDQGIADLSKPAASNTFLPGSDDQIFGGSATEWIKTAWTIKARYHNRLSKKDATGSANLVLADLNNGISSNADNCKSQHYSTDPNQWADFQNARSKNVMPCQTLIDSMHNMADPRTPFYFDTTGQHGIAVGNPLGQAQVTGSGWGPYLNNPSGSTPLVTCAEANFLKAEANARLGNMAAAVNALQLAITSSISDVTAGTSSGITQANAYTLANTSIHSIIFEKWKAMFGQPIEAYSDYRRTGFPFLAIRPNAIRTFIPRRLPTDLSEQTNNSNAPIYDLSVPVWYAQ